MRERSGDRLRDRRERPLIDERPQRQERHDRDGPERDPLASQRGLDVGRTAASGAARRGRGCRCRSGGRAWRPQPARPRSRASPPAAAVDGGGVAAPSSPVRQPQRLAALARALSRCSGISVTAASAEPSWADESARHLRRRAGAECTGLERERWSVRLQNRRARTTTAPGFSAPLRPLQSPLLDTSGAAVEWLCIRSRAPAPEARRGGGEASVVALDRVPDPHLCLGSALSSLRRNAGRSASPCTWGEAMLGGAYVFALLFLVFGVVPHQWLIYADNELGWRDGQDPRRARRSERRLVEDLPFTHQYAGAPRHRRRRYPRRLLRRCRSSCWALVAEARQGQAAAEIATSDVRPTAGEARHSRWHAPTPTRRCRRSRRLRRSSGGRRRLPRPRRSSRSSSSTSTSPSASCARAASTSARGSASTWSRPTPSTRRPAPSSPASDPSDHVVFIIDDDICTRCALCVDRCPTGVIILGKAGAADRRPATPTRAPTATATPTACGSGGSTSTVAKTIDEQAESRRSRIGSNKLDGIGAGQPGLELDLPAGLDLPQGLHRQPPQPLLRDHELGAVPPAPGEGEAPRGEGQLHAVPRRAQLLPLHPADGHRHLPDVLLPARPPRRPGTTSTTCRPR